MKIIAKTYNQLHVKGRPVENRKTREKIDVLMSQDLMETFFKAKFWSNSVDLQKKNVRAGVRNSE